MARAVGPNQRRRRTGATVVEYAIMLVLVAVVVLAAISALGTATSESFETSRDQIAAAVNSNTP